MKVMCIHRTGNNRGFKVFYPPEIVTVIESDLLGGYYPVYVFAEFPTLPDGGKAYYNQKNFAPLEMTEQEIEELEMELV